MTNRKIDSSWIALTVSVAIAIGVMGVYWTVSSDRTNQFDPFDEEMPIGFVPRKSDSTNDFNHLAARKSIVYIKCLVPGLGPMFGTGFLVSPDGLIYTNRHVIRPDQPIRGSIILVGVPSATKRDGLDFFKAEIVHATPSRDSLDFAVLKVAAKENYGLFPALPLGSDSVELASPVAVLGYPFITSDQQVFAFNPGIISATRVVLDAQAYYQTNADVNPGNSGGPLLNLRGEAIGIVTKRKTNAIGMNYALQLKDVQAAATLAKRQASESRPEPGPLDPQQMPSLPSIPPKKAAWDIVHGNARVQGGVLNIDNNGGPYWIATKDDLPENFQMVLTCKVEFLQGRQQVRPSHDDIRRSLFIRFGAEDIDKNIMDSVGTRLQFRDHDAMFWQENRLLKDGPQGSPDDFFVLTISRQRGFVTVAVDDDVVFSSATSTELKTPTKLSIGGILSRLQLGEVSIIALEPGPTPVKWHPNPNKAKFEYLVKGNFGPPILIPPEYPPPLIAIDVPELEGERVERPIRSRIADVAVGGGGRYLVLHLPDVSELAIFDISLAKVVRTIPLAEADAKFAVGLDKVVVALPGKKRLERWDLLTGAREKAATLPIKEPLALAVMGSASRGPILIGAGAGKDAEWALVDVHSLKPLGYRRTEQARIPIDKDLQVRASADGSVFAGSGSIQNPGIATLVIAGNEVRGYFTKEGAGHAVPGPDGRFIYTPQGLVGTDLKPLGKPGRNQFTLPAAEGYHELRFDMNAERPASAFLHIAGDDRPIAQVRKEWLADVDLNDRGSFPGDKRVHFIPSAKVIVTIPRSNDRVVLHRFDADDVLEKSALDYLYVTSLPPIWGRKGANYRYQLAARSRYGELKYRVIAGPVGLTVSKTGMITWAVPALYPDHECEVVIAVSDPTQQEVQHAFKIALQEQPTK
jgi:V8-like Glu-specific endopeptidase